MFQHIYVKNVNKKDAWMPTTQPGKMSLFEKCREAEKWKESKDSIRPCNVFYANGIEQKVMEQRNRMEFKLLFIGERPMLLVSCAASPSFPTSNWRFLLRKAFVVASLNGVSLIIVPRLYHIERIIVVYSPSKTRCWTHDPWRFAVIFERMKNRHISYFSCLSKVCHYLRQIHLWDNPHFDHATETSEEANYAIKLSKITHAPLRAKPISSHSTNLFGEYYTLKVLDSAHETQTQLSQRME